MADFSFSPLLCMSQWQTEESPLSDLSFTPFYSISVLPFQSVDLPELGSTSTLKRGTDHRAPGVTGEYHYHLPTLLLSRPETFCPFPCLSLLP